MELQGHPKEQRAEYLRRRLEPKRLLADLDAANQPNRPWVELIGIKAANRDQEEFYKEAVPEFIEHLQSDPAITEQIRPYVELGFRLRWTGYSDATGVEHCLAIVKIPEAEHRLRARVRSSGLD